MEEIIKVGKKEFKVLEQLSDNSFKVERKNKIFFLKQFSANFGNYQYFIEHRKRFQNSGVKSPKIILKDKKSLTILTEYVEGENVLELLYKDPLDEEIYKQMFKMNYLARTSKMNLDFDPSNYVFSNGKLYYFGLKYFDYKEEDNFVQKGIRLWFYTKEFSNLLLEKGHQIDKSRLKEDYAINKEIVLMTVKYYYWFKKSIRYNH